MKVYPKTSVKQKAFLAVFGLSLCVVILEVGLRTAGFVYLAAQNHRNEQSIKNNGGFRILCLGESTTALGEESSYPRQLENILNQQNTGIKFSVINKGVAGTQTTEILAKLENNLNRYKPHMVIVMMGINDDDSLFICENAGVSITNILELLKSFRVYKLANFLHDYVISDVKKRKLEIPKSKTNMLFDATTEIRLLQEDNVRKRKMQLENITNLSPEDINVYIEIGLFYFENKKYAEGIEIFNKIIDIDPEEIRPYLHLVNGYTALGDTKKKNEVVSIIFETASKNIEHYFELGFFYFENRKYAEGIEIFNKIIDIDPERIRAYIYLVKGYIALGNIKKKNEVADIAIKMASRSVEVFDKLGFLFIELKEYKKAEEVFLTVLENETENIDMYLVLGNLYFNQQKYKKAEEIFNLALMKDPRNEEVYFSLVRLYCSQNEANKAQEAFRKMVEINPKNEKAYVFLAEYYGYQGEIDKSKKLLTDAIKINPTNYRAHVDLGMCYRLRKEYGVAKNILRKAIKINPSNDRAYKEMLFLLYETQIRRVHKNKDLIMKNGLEREGCRTITQHNYQKLKQMVIKQWIPLIAVQYPMQNVEVLKQILGNQDNIVFVDNEKTFKEAVQQEGYDVYFTDKFAGTFGHATKKGNRLLAENIASAILKKYFLK